MISRKFHSFIVPILLLLISYFHYANTVEANKISGIYDFIVVGSGTAGSVIASRLSENRNHKVLLIEAGPVPNPGLDIPAISRRYWTNENVRFYNSVPQNTLGMGNNRVLRYTTGRMLGGTSQINGMFINRGSPHDYDNWALITGDDSWSYKNMLRYFKKMETYRGDFPSQEHGYDGPITISRPKYSPGLNIFLKAASYLGYPVADPNGPQTEGFAPVEFNKRNGRRVSAFSGYIKPVLMKRPNLEVVTNSEVKRILFNEKGDTAIGVSFMSIGISKPIQVRASKEVVISAGTLNSPTILMKSGIGPKDVLNSCGIEPVKILPVGRNLQDHLSVRLDFSVKNITDVLIPEKDFTMENFLKFNKIGDGPYSTSTGCTAQAFLTSSKSLKNGIRSWPDLHIYNAHTTEYPASLDYAPYRDLLLQGIDQKREALVTVFGMLTRPKSRGRITLNSTNIDSDPLIDFNYLSHPDDIQAIIDVLKYMLQIYEKTPSMRKTGATLPNEPLPQCNHLKFRSDEYWRCYIRFTASVGLHAASSCKMGRGVNDPQAVVDSQLKVIGIKGLRVADCSIMPDVTNANTQTPAYVIAEKAADMIKESLID